MSFARLSLSLSVLGLAGCAGVPAGNEPPRYELRCKSTDTADKTVFYCMRHDTRTGDVRRVDVERLPVTRGPTAVAEEAAGTYTLVCHATTTNVLANLYCLRLNTVTGDMVVIDLQKADTIPGK